MTPADANDLIKRLLGAYPTQRQRMSVADIGAMTVSYTAGLSDLSFDVARAAVDRSIKTSEWIPTIALIRKEAGEVQGGSRRSGSEAWGDVMRAISRFGSHRTPAFVDPQVNEVVGIVTWRQICEADGRTLASCRRTFIDTYDAINADQRKRDQIAAGAAAPPRHQLTDRGATREPYRELVDRVARTLTGPVVEACRVCAAFHADEHRGGVTCPCRCHDRTLEPAVAPAAHDDARGDVQPCGCEGEPHTCGDDGGEDDR